MLTHVYRVTKYDPADRDEHGRYVGAEDCVSDHGEVEAAYLQAVAAFAAGTGVDHMDVREPEVPSLLQFGAEPAVDGFGLEGLFPSGQAGFHDGARVSLDVALELVRAMLRDNGAWCRLEVEDTFAVHVGWDQYLYVSSTRPCEEALARTRALGLFPERLDASPYAFDAEGDEGQGIQRPADDSFWADLRREIAGGRAGLLEEMYLYNASRWHLLTGATVEAVRARLALRARLAVWPPLSTDVHAVLGGLPADGLVQGVWQDHDGLLHSADVDEDHFAELTARMSGARAAALLSPYAGERIPLCTAVLPDKDGVLRARWRP
ncbi:RNA-binding protein [Streptomyces justiciae]|uniref:RNA-binding protein n=1 Tax=Streptomyces justiciae TaxID=2780140 RepID=A0ABU3M4Q1_9ACTN|nr:RNA-binding protein [Streptomyces justiciae]MDT7845718.1 RNA-binding protein [Streptomyces justiciae]